MNIAKLMKQAQQMQAGLAAKQEELASQTVQATAGGKVTVTATCSGDVTSIVIDPSVVDASDVEFLQDLVLKAVQDAILTGKELAAAEMKKLTGGLNIPGL